MNKEYALELLEMVERKTLDKNSPLIKEAIRYLEKLKIDTETKNRIWKIKFN